MGTWLVIDVSLSDRSTTSAAACKFSAHPPQCTPAKLDGYAYPAYLPSSWAHTLCTHAKS